MYSTRNDCVSFQSRLFIDEPERWWTAKVNLYEGQMCSEMFIACMRKSFCSDLVQRTFKRSDFKLIIVTWSGSASLSPFSPCFSDRPDGMACYLISRQGTEGSNVVKCTKLSRKQITDKLIDREEFWGYVTRKSEEVYANYVTWLIERNQFY